MDEKVRKQHYVKVCSTTNNRVITLGQIGPYLKICDFRAKAIFKVVENLSVNILTRTDFMKMYVTSIYPYRKMVRANSWKYECYPFDRSL